MARRGILALSSSDSGSCSRLRDQTVMCVAPQANARIRAILLSKSRSSLDISLDAQLASLDRVRSEKAARARCGSPAGRARDVGWVGSEAQMG